MNTKRLLVTSLSALLLGASGISLAATSTGNDASMMHHESPTMAHGASGSSMMGGGTMGSRMGGGMVGNMMVGGMMGAGAGLSRTARSEENTSELQSLMLTPTFSTRFCSCL